jgi:hypothetical protein
MKLFQLERHPASDYRARRLSLFGFCLHVGLCFRHGFHPREMFAL